MSKYYNEETKERFLNFIDKSKYPPRWWELLFERTKVTEELKQRDLYDFSTQELMGFYKCLNIADLSSLFIYNNNVTKYENWAFQQNLIADNQVHGTEITIETLNECVSKDRLRKSIITYDQLKSIRFLNAQDAFLIWCLFEGIKGKNYEDILNLKLKDINVQEKTVKLHSGRTIKVSEDFIYIAIAADAQDEYNELSTTGHVKKLQPSEKIFKEKVNGRGVDVPRAIYANINRTIRRMNGMNSEQRAKDLTDSGLIYYLNKRADEYNMSTIQMMYDELTNHSGKCIDIIEKYNFNMRVIKKWTLLYGDFLH